MIIGIFSIIRNGSYVVVLIICMTVGLPVSSQTTRTISGYVEDLSSGEKLIAATVFDEVSKKGVLSNTYGFFSLSLPTGEVKLITSYVGFKSVVISFFLSKDTSILISMGEIPILQQVEIVESRVERPEDRVQMSQVDVPINQVKKAPSLLGETDVLKVLQLLPGVKSGGEGQNGLYIRGGSPDQNFILLDGVPVYNVSHLGGFFSVFNGDAIRNVTLTKGGFPARYGGRLSSVIEIDMKEGNMKEFHGEGGIGLISSRLTLEGPILKDKISFLISGRRTYLDLIARPFLASSLKKENQLTGHTTRIGFKAHFYDLNAKINYKINNRHRIYLSTYHGLDIFGLKLDQQRIDKTGYDLSNAGFDWGNITTALRWNWLMSKKLFANTIVTFSDYKVNIGVEQNHKFNTVIDNNLAKYLSGIRDWAAKFDLDYVLNPSYRIRTGIGAVIHAYKPGALQLKNNTNRIVVDTTLGSIPINAREMYIYMENEFQIGWLKANMGVHASAFRVQGSGYGSIQPRISLHTQILHNIGLKFSFVSMRQYINLLTNERAGLPTDLWVPATAKIKPQKAWQAAIGLSKTLSHEVEFTLEGYFKNMHNLISYKDGANLINANGNWEDQVTQGDGVTYGTELFLQKKSGKTTGWIGYTLSWNQRIFPDLNQGKQFPFKYDRRHEFSILAAHPFSKRFSISGSWQFGTGNAVTIPTASYQGPSIHNKQWENSPAWLLQNTQIYDLNQGKNQFRMPPYHRMDLSFEFNKEKKQYIRTWVIGAYNVYNRANPFYLSIETETETINGEIKSRRVVNQTSLFPIVPYFSYNFKF